MTAAAARRPTPTFSTPHLPSRQGRRRREKPHASKKKGRRRVDGGRTDGGSRWVRKSEDESQRGTEEYRRGDHRRSQGHRRPRVFRDD
ncbi:hypothetical protein LINPERPRIM_LOCUS25791 [Linum perenne]